ncbi:MAG: magnesium transporter [Bacteroidetes bacterium]|nr:MAG: magnesium transporter [Bacteroidota bacterium]
MKNTKTQNIITGARGGPRFDVDAEFVHDFVSLIDSGQSPMVLNILADLHPADLGEVIEHLPLEQARTLFRWLPVEQGGDVLAELDDDFRAALLEETSHARLTALIDELDSDDAADVIADLPEELAEIVLPSLEDAEDVKELLSYDEDSAGGIMATEYVAVLDSDTVSEATEEVRRSAEEDNEIFAVFVTDANKQLTGVISLKRLLLSRSASPVTLIMDTDVVSVATDLDQEEVARVMERYDLVSLPVVDDQNILVGMISIDDVVDVIREEAEEDIQRMSGVARGEEPTDSVIKIMFGRLPWLLAGLGGASLAAGVIWGFHDALARVPILAGFIPIIMATAGNAGIQSSAITVQQLASGDVWATNLGRRLGKEVKVAMLNGLISSLVLGAAILFLAPLLVSEIADPPMLALTSMIALLLVIIQATTFGTMIPLLLNRFGIDPALATGPFITTSNDVIGILVFFTLAELMYIG